MWLWSENLFNFVYLYLIIKIIHLYNFVFLIQITFPSPFLSAVASTFHIKAILFPGKNLHNCLYNQTFANISVIHHSLGEFSVDEIFLPTRFFSEVLDCQHKTFQNWILIKSKWFCVYCHANGSRHKYSQTR